ncbi:hypothetical protein HZS_4082 [Henneguya salminicola]|nr:hypothetical protein HZS_4082 [Henneguya salminicola]
MIKTLCPRPTNFLSLNHLICERHPNVCDHFVCAHNFSVTVSDVFYFDLGKRRCIIPNTPLRVGLLSRAPNYMLCGVDRNHTTSYCWDNICKNGINGQTCRMGMCHEFRS